MDSRRVFLIVFWLFAGTIAFAILGTLSLYIEPVERFFLPYYQTLVAAPTWTYMALMPIVTLALYWKALGPWKSVAFFLAASLIGAGSELLGTRTGIPFAPYEYTDRLGPKIAGDVPYFIPSSWYAMAVLCYDLGGRLRLGVAGRVLATAVLMVVWDVALDPAMNNSGGSFVFWIYPGGGPYFGMPWVNWYGWLVTSILIALAFEVLGGMKAAPDRLTARWAPWLFSLNIFFPIAICLLYGRPAAGIIAAVVLAITMGVIRWRKPGAITAEPVPA
ncbi:MAG: bisanhydrobacterioruberin hydratase CruF [Bacteroidota bacterium]